MKIFSRIDQEVSTPSLGKCVRFSVTVAGDDDKPLMTVQGFRLTKDRKILPPKNKTRLGFAQYVQVSEEFEEMLQSVLEENSEVVEILGPKLPEEFGGSRRLKTEAKEVKV